MHLILFKNRRLKKADYALNQGRLQKTFKLAVPFVNSHNNEIAYQANRLCGLARYKQKKYEDSIGFFEKTCQLENYRHDWYNLAMALAFVGKLEKAEEAFKNIYRTNVQPGYMYTVPVPGLLFQYLKVLKQKQFVDAAIARANELKQMFDGVGTSDVTKQVERGLPSYPMFLKEVKGLIQQDKFNAWEKGFNTAYK